MKHVEVIRQQYASEVCSTYYDLQSAPGLSGVARRSGRRPVSTSRRPQSAALRNSKPPASIRLHLNISSDSTTGTQHQSNTMVNHLPRPSSHRTRLLVRRATHQQQTSTPREPRICPRQDRSTNLRPQWCKDHLYRILRRKC